MFSYVSNRVPEISNEIYKIDAAMCAGFGWEIGPFETWDAIGLKKGLSIMNDLAHKPSKWIQQIINDGVDFQSFQVDQEISRTELVNRYSNSTATKVSNLFSSMGRLHKIKRFDILIDAFHLFLKEDLRPLVYQKPSS